jgi:hypothetical protein
MLSYQWVNKRISCAQLSRYCRDKVLKNWTKRCVEGRPTNDFHEILAAYFQIFEQRRRVLLKDPPDNLYSIYII